MRNKFISLAILITSILLVLPFSVHSAVVSSVTVKREVLTKLNIPCLVCWQKGRKKAPLAIVVHWSGGCKEEVRDIGEELAKRGFIAVLPDTRDHGERKPLSAYMQYNFLQTMLADSRDISLIIDSMKDDKRADIEKVGMTGISMGAIITYLTVTIDKRVIAAAPMAGTPDWSFLSSLEGRRLDGTTGRYEPLSHPERFYPCAFLMVHGTIDRTCPIEGPRRLFQALKPFYHKTSEKLQMSEYRGQGHTVDAKMKQEAIAWLERWLIKEQPKRK